MFRKIKMRKISFVNQRCSLRYVFDKINFNSPCIPLRGREGIICWLRQGMG